MQRLSHEEYNTLSDQKADDWRSISEVNPTLFGVAGAIFAAGVAQSQPEVVALSTLPLYLGVWHMIRHARLQLQLTSYLAAYAPDEISWERDIVGVRRKFWKRTERDGWTRELLRASAWNTWLAISCLLSVVVMALPALAGYDAWGRAFVLGTAVTTVGAGVCIWQARKVESDRDIWADLWKEHDKDREPTRDPCQQPDDGS